MPKLQDNRATTTVDLKSAEGGQAVVFASMLARDMEAVATRTREGGNNTLFPFTFLIKSWNLTDDNDEPLPVNEENIGRLAAEDILTIQEAVNLEDFLGRAENANSAK